LDFFNSHFKIKEREGERERGKEGKRERGGKREREKNNKSHFFLHLAKP